MTSLPWEVFVEITDHLPREDLPALLSVSRKVHTLTEPALYRSVAIERKPTFTKLARVLAAKPHLCDTVRSFSVGKRAPWWSLDLLDSFASLREFDFEVDDVKKWVPMIDEMAKGTWIRPTLKRCSIKLYYVMMEDLPVEVQERLLYAILSAQPLEDATVFYALGDSFSVSEHRDSPVSVRRLPYPSGVRCTNLRALTLQWDGLSLHWLSALLDLPRALEVIHLQFGERYTMHGPDVSMPLELALRPIADTLRTLTILPVDGHPEDDDPRWRLEKAGLRWGPSGLRELRNLDILGIPGWSWAGQLPSSEWYPLSPPKSITTLLLYEACLDLSSSSESLADKWLILDLGSLVNMVNAILAVLEGASRLEYLQVDPIVPPDVEDALRVSSLVYLTAPFRPVVDRGIKIVVQPPEGDRIELETRLLEDENTS